MTATDTLYATGFPSLEQLDRFVVYDIGKCVTDRDVGISCPTWLRELKMCTTNHALLKTIFESRLDPTVVREVGLQIHANGGTHEMMAFYYTYCHFISSRLKDMGLTKDQWMELHYANARKVEYLWNGVVEWMY